MDVSRIEQHAGEIRSWFWGLSQAEWLDVIEIAVVLFAAWVAWRQLSLLRRQMQDDQLRHRRENALKYSLSNNPILREAQMRVDMAFSPEVWGTRPIPAEVLQKTLTDQPEIRNELITLLANWENLSLCNASDIADHDLAFEMVATTLVQYVDRFQNFIALRQQDKPRAYAYLVHQADQWRRPIVTHEKRRLYKLTHRCL